MSKSLEMIVEPIGTPEQGEEAKRRALKIVAKWAMERKLARERRSKGGAQDEGGIVPSDINGRAGR